MPTYRCPVLIWKNSAGLYTASLVEQHDRAAVATTPREALEQLRSLLDWQYREEPWRDPPDLKEPVLEVFKVPVRPEYQDEMTGRRYPVQSPVDLKIWCVIGRQLGGPSSQSRQGFHISTLAGVRICEQEKWPQTCLGEKDQHQRRNTRPENSQQHSIVGRTICRRNILCSDVMAHQRLNRGAESEQRNEDQPVNTEGQISRGEIGAA